VLNVLSVNHSYFPVAKSRSVEIFNCKSNMVLYCVLERTERWITMLVIALQIILFSLSVCKMPVIFICLTLARDWLIVKIGQLLLERTPACLVMSKFDR